MMEPVAPASKLIGKRVRNRSGEELGTIEDIVLDLGTGTIAYAVLLFGGFLGVGAKLFAVPWEALEFDGRVFFTDATRAELEESAGFDPDHWPEKA